MSYRIVRFYANPNKSSENVRGMCGLSLEEAQEHCNDPETSSRTCTNSTGKTRTHKQRIGSSA